MKYVDFSPAMIGLLRESLARLSGSMQMRQLLAALPEMSEAEKVRLAPEIAVALQPHLLRPLLDAMNSPIEVLRIEEPAYDHNKALDNMADRFDDLARSPLDDDRTERRPLLPRLRRLLALIFERRA